MKRVLVAVVLGTGAFIGTGRAEPSAHDPFAVPLDRFATADPFAAPTQKSAAAGDEALKEPARFVLETHTVKAAGDGAPQTVTLKLNTATGEVRQFDGKAFVRVAVEGEQGWQPEVVDENPEHAEDVQRREAVIAKMKEIILPELNFRQASVENVIVFLADASREYDPDKIGVGFASVAVGSDGGKDVAPANKEAGATVVADPFAFPSVGSLVPSLITFQARDVSLYDTISIVAILADLRWRVRGGAIVWSERMPHSETVKTKVFRLSPPTVQWIERVLAEQEDAEVEAATNPFAMSPTPATTGAMAGADTGLARLLLDLGVGGLWDPRSSVSLRPDVGLLTVTTVLEGLAQCDTLVSALNLQYSLPGRFRLLPVERPDDSQTLLLLDLESGSAWEYKLAPGEPVDGRGRFVRVDEPPSVEPLK